MPGDGRGPAAETRPVAPEPAQVPGDLQPGVGGHVLGVVADDPAQIAEQSGLHEPVRDRESGLVAVLGPRDGRAQFPVVRLHAPGFPSLAQELSCSYAVESPGIAPQGRVRRRAPTVISAGHRSVTVPQAPPVPAARRPGPRLTAARGTARARGPGHLARRSSGHAAGPSHPVGYGARRWCSDSQTSPPTPVRGLPAQQSQRAVARRNSGGPRRPGPTAARPGVRSQYSPPVSHHSAPV